MRRVILVVIVLFLICTGVLASVGGKLRIICPPGICLIYVDNRLINTMDKRMVAIKTGIGYHEVTIRNASGSLIYKDRVNVGANKSTVVKVPRKKK